MEPIAQTNVQLYNQLHRSGYTDDELLPVHRAYRFATSVYSGYFQADGKPSVCHVVGVASILASHETDHGALAQASSLAEARRSGGFCQV